MNKYFEICEKKVRLRDGSVHSVTGKPEAYAVSPKISEQDELTAVCIDAEIQTQAPAFGYQKAFADRNGVEIDLKLSEGYPFVSIYQHKEWWIRPAFGTVFSEIPEQSQLVIFKRPEDYLVFLAVSGKENRADLVGWEKGLRLTLSSNCAGKRKMQDVALICGAGKDPYAVTEEAVKWALKLSGKNLKLRREKEFPEILRKLGWCSWDSLGQSVNMDAVVDKVKELKEKEVPVQWVLIDDGWSDSEGQMLKSFEADPVKFPGGIKETVSMLKEAYKMKYVGVWQAIKGYWNGILPGSQAEKENAAFLATYPNGEITVKPQADAVFGFWNQWHAFLKNAGVDFIKVDSQSSFSIMTQGTVSYGEAAKAVHTGLEASADLHFNGNLINCMGMAPEDIWNRQSAALSRNSDDYTPMVPGSFMEHALQNAYDSVYHGCFYWGDWDMVWSKHEDVEQSILLRVISGGPLYISDGLGKTDPEKLWPVIFNDGTIIRCQDVGRPTLDCLTAGNVMKEKPLKIYNKYGDHIYVAAFLDRSSLKAVKDEILLKDLPGTENGKEWYVYDHKKKAVDKYDGFTCEIKPGEANLYQLIPATGKFTMVGLINKYISNGVAEEKRVGDDICLWEMKADGDFRFIAEEDGVKVTSSTGKVNLIREGKLCTVKNVKAGEVLVCRK